MILSPQMGWKCSGGQLTRSPCWHVRSKQTRRASRPFTTCALSKRLPEQQASQLSNSIVVVGAGPAGLATTAALQTVGLPAVLLERRSALGTTGALGLWTNAWRALEALQAADPLRKQHLVVDTVELCRSSGRRLRSFTLGQCDGGPHEFRGVRRSNLLQALASRLAPGTLLFDLPVDSVELGPLGASLQLGGEEQQRVECLAVVGADGVRSAATAATGRAEPRYVGQSVIRGIATYPEGVPCGVIRQVWGQGPRAGMYPISDTELYWFVCFDATADAPIPSTPEAVRQEALQLVAGWEWGVQDAIQRTAPEELTRSRIMDRWDLPGGAGGCLTLAGDALHPMTPNLGQGGCTALEDAVVLARLLRDAGVPQQAQQAQQQGGGRGGSAREALVGAISSVFGEYERQRARRCLPITVRSFGMGALLQLPLPPVVAARDLFVEHLFSPSHFLDHATFDCGRLD